MTKREKYSETLGVGEDAGTRTIQAKFRGRIKNLQASRIPVSTKTFQELNEAYHFLLQNRPKNQSLASKHVFILSADVAGYSRMMAENEEETLKFFYFCKEVFEDLVISCNGRIFNTAGDAILSEFGEASDAVSCAIEIQKEMRGLNLGQPEAQRILFRMGLNKGEVFINESDLLGDAVNIAARIQTAAAPGGICISGAVYDLIKDHPPGSVVFLGEKSFKNIPEPIRTYAITELGGNFRFSDNSLLTIGKPPASSVGAMGPTVAKSDRMAEHAREAPVSGLENRYVIFFVCVVLVVGAFLAGRYRKTEKTESKPALVNLTQAVQQGRVFVSTTPESQVAFYQNGVETFRSRTPITREFNPGNYKVRIENPSLAVSEELDLVVEEGKLVRIEKILVPSASGASGATGTNSEPAFSEGQVAELRNAAAEGDVEANYRLGKHYVEAKSDYENAYLMFRMAAVKDHPEAQYELGVLFYSGKGATQDYEASIYWLIKSALSGSKKANDFLARNNFPREFDRDIANQRRIDRNDSKGGNLTQIQHLRLDELKQNLEGRHLLN